MTKSNYNTKQKSAVSDELKNMGDSHFTVDSFCELLSKKGQNIGRTTVYRYLEKFSESGLLRKFVMPQGNSVCYQYIGDNIHCREHFHLKCEKCGRLIHIDCDEMNSFLSHIKTHHGFSVNPLKTVIYGVCERCSAE